jgi:hypothetical protein
MSHPKLSDNGRGTVCFYIRHERDMAYYNVLYNRRGTGHYDINILWRGTALYNISTTWRVWVFY